MRRWAMRCAAVAAVLFAVLGLWSAAGSAPDPSPAARAQEVTASLRCPSCAGEAVADSAAPLAAAMRTTVAEQVADGRTAEEIEAWFAQRYGDEVLLDPPRRGSGWLLWVVPVAVAGGILALAVGRGAGDRRSLGRAVCAVVAVAGVTWGAVASSGPPGGSAGTAPDVSVPVTSVLADAVADAPGDVDLRLALARALDEEGRSGDAVEHYAAAARLHPLDVGIAYEHAFALVRSGASSDAEAVLRANLDQQADHAPSLLLLGTSLWRGGDPGGEVMLRRFLELDPGHLAAADVRALLDDGVPVRRGTVPEEEP